VAGGGMTSLIHMELRKCQRGLVNVATDLRTAATREERQRALADANSNLFYGLGLLCSQGVVLSEDLTGRGAETETRASDGCERLGREIDRLISGSRAGNFETAGRIADAAKACWRGLAIYDVETGETALASDTEELAEVATGTRGVRRPPIPGRR
jgi:hypothetical protein